MQVYCMSVIANYNPTAPAMQEEPKASPGAAGYGPCGTSISLRSSDIDKVTT